mmetsp:Transcript_26621/g.79423  ORF Transcript_26621/g.79423 Transcript_26621/m.79423 type:complete len:287 (+) Transcript_26621:2879-3739(+)
MPGQPTHTTRVFFFWRNSWTSGRKAKFLPSLGALSSMSHFPSLFFTTFTGSWKDTMKVVSLVVMLASPSRSLTKLSFSSVPYFLTGGLLTWSNPRYAFPLASSSKKSSSSPMAPQYCRYMPSSSSMTICAPEAVNVRLSSFVSHLYCSTPFGLVTMTYLYSTFAWNSTLMGAGDFQTGKMSSDVSRRCPLAGSQSPRLGWLPTTRSTSPKLTDSSAMWKYTLVRRAACASSAPGIPEVSGIPEANTRRAVHRVQISPVARPVQLYGQWDITWARRWVPLWPSILKA